MLRLAHDLRRKTIDIAQGGSYNVFIEATNEYRNLQGRVQFPTGGIASGRFPA